MYVLKKRLDAIFGSYEYSGLEAEQYEEIVRVGNIPVVIVCTQTGNVEIGNFNSIISYEEAGGKASHILVESRLLSPKSIIIYK